MNVEFCRHNLDEIDIANVVSVLNSTILTTGATVGEFEKRFSEYVGQRYTVGLTSCTAALHLSLLAYGIGPGDEVITTPMTFIATANSILQAGATPVFVDVEAATGNINAELVGDAITPTTKAIMPVHLYGHMCDMKTIRQISDRHGLRVVEDAAHAIEARRDGVGVGELADAACFSFYATKNITSGEGGAASTNDGDVADQLKKLRLHGMSKDAADRYSKRYEHWDMEVLGWKYNMDNIQAALLLHQLERIDDRWQRREAICRAYEDALESEPQVELLKVLPNSTSARHMFTVLVSPELRDRILWRLQEKGIGVAVNYRAIHLLKYYRETYGYDRGAFPVAERMGDRTITLPLYPKLTDEEVEYVVRALKETVAECHAS